MKLGLLAVSATLGIAKMTFANDPVKIGFVVKQPEEPWFQSEWRFAEMAGKDKGFTVVKIAGESAEKVLAAIDNLAAQKAQGLVICVPDVKLGPSVVAAAKRANIKLMTVDDRLIDGSGKVIESVPHMGIDAVNIGKQVGKAIAAEIAKRGWKMDEVAAIRISYDQLPTAKDRTNGATEALVKAGFKAANIFDTPQAKTDTENAFNAANTTLTQHPQFKKWVAFGLNDEAVLGAVRAAEGHGVNANNMIGVGIGGDLAAINEFKKSNPTGFFSTILISPKRHGYDTSTLVYEWVKSNKEPAKLTITDGYLMNRQDYVTVRKSAGFDN